MSLAPLLDASVTIVVHAVAASAAFALGLVQLGARKGTRTHRVVGWLWVLLMATVAAGSLLIHEIRLWGDWSPIHILSVFTLVSLVLGVLAARAHRVQQHRWTMISLFLGALVIAGIFTFVPGRIMHAVLFGA